MCIMHVGHIVDYNSHCCRHKPVALLLPSVSTNELMLKLTAESVCTDFMLTLSWFQLSVAFI